MQKLVKTGKYTETNNPMSSFGLIEENIELSHIHLAVNSTSPNFTTAGILFNLSDVVSGLQTLQSGKHTVSI